MAFFLARGLRFLARGAGLLGKSTIMRLIKPHTNPSEAHRLDPLVPTITLSYHPDEARPALEDAELEDAITDLGTGLLAASLLSGRPLGQWPSIVKISGAESLPVDVQAAAVMEAVQVQLNGWEDALWGAAGVMARVSEKMSREEERKVAVETEVEVRVARKLEEERGEIEEEWKRVEGAAKERGMLRLWEEQKERIVAAARKVEEEKWELEERNEVLEKRVEELEVENAVLKKRKRDEDEEGEDDDVSLASEGSSVSKRVKIGEMPLEQLQGLARLVDSDYEDDGGDDDDNNLEAFYQ
jgi:hypothetical protein